MNIMGRCDVCRRTTSMLNTAKDVDEWAEDRGWFKGARGSGQLICHVCVGKDNAMTTSSNNLEEAIKGQLQQMASGPMTVMALRRISKFADVSAKMLASVSTGIPKTEELRMADRGSVGAVDLEDDVGGYGGSVFAGSPPAETFGARAIRELVAMFPVAIKSIKEQHETPDRLVAALVAANAAGLTDVAAKLREKLGVDAGVGAAPAPSVTARFTAALVAAKELDGGPT